MKLQTNPKSARQHPTVNPKLPPAFRSSLRSPPPAAIMPRPLRRFAQTLSLTQSSPPGRDEHGISPASSSSSPPSSTLPPLETHHDAPSPAPPRTPIFAIQSQGLGASSADRCRMHRASSSRGGASQPMTCASASRMHNPPRDPATLDRHRCHHGRRPAWTSVSTTRPSARDTHRSTHRHGRACGGQHRIIRPCPLTPQCAYPTR